MKANSQVGLQNYTTDILGVAVDLTPGRMLKDELRERATHEAVLVF